MNDSPAKVLLTDSQRRVVADILPEFTDRLKLDEKNPRMVYFSVNELQTIGRKAQAAIGHADNGMKRNSLRHVIDAIAAAVESAEGIGSIPVSVRLYQFRITLLQSEPTIWRRIQVKECSLDKLHEFSPDPSIMPLVIEAVETYGRENEAYRQVGLSRDLVQSEKTIDWIIGELNTEQTARYENYAYNLSMVLLNAAPTLLLTRESDILEARHFLDELREPFTQRLHILSWDAATCWQRLEEFCEQGKDKEYINEVNLNDANLIVEALARCGDECEARVHELLTIQIDDYRHHPMKWLEPLVVRLAGLTRLELTIPLIVGKLLEDGGDLLNQECAEALTRIGTPAVLHAIAEAFPRAERHFRIYATNPLEHIQSDLAVEITLKLLELEQDDQMRLDLAHTLLCQFAHEGIEIARHLLLGRELDFNARNLRNYLLVTCTLTGERFPEYDNWMAAEKAETAEHWRRVKELEEDPEGLLLFALERLAGKEAMETPKPKRPAPSVPWLAEPRPAKKQKVGRNAPCPCGSGRKFKNCCMRK